MKNREIKKRVPSVFWITGLSGSGKSTICRLLVDVLRKKGRSVVMLDGDELRDVMGAEELHSRADRLKLAMRYARMCRMLALQNLDVAISTISLFKEVHEWNRQNVPGYVEIYMKVPLDELARRDPKKIYARAARGELENVAGFDLPVDFPSAPDFTIAYHEGLTIEATLNHLLEKLKIDQI
jgi:adenylylsulfate kinase-like enzyme